MREIKFRAWDIEAKEFKDMDEVTVDVQSDGTLCGCWHDEDGPWEVILMQYTGLKDKNGKEIYEGDIVEFPPFNKDYCEGEYLPRQRFTVSLDTIRLWLKEEKFGYEGELLLDNTNSEVIGNIYENPERGGK